MANDEGGKISGFAVFFHILMILITGGFWVGILIIWVLIKAVSQKQQCSISANDEVIIVRKYLAFICTIVLVAILCCGCSNNDKCKACRGSGYYNKRTCSFCNGTGHSDNKVYDDLEDFYYNGY